MRGKWKRNHLLNIDELEGGGKNLLPSVHLLHFDQKSICLCKVNEDGNEMEIE